MDNAPPKMGSKNRILIKEGVYRSRDQVLTFAMFVHIDLCLTPPHQASLFIGLQLEQLEMDASTVSESIFYLRFNAVIAHAAHRLIC